MSKKAHQPLFFGDIFPCNQRHCSLLTYSVSTAWVLALQSCCSPFTVTVPSLFNLQPHSGMQLGFSELLHKLLASGKCSKLQSEYCV